MTHKLLRDTLFLMWVAFHEDRQRLIASHGRFRPSFIHRDEVANTLDGFANPRRDYANYRSRPSRVVKDRSDFADQTFKGTI